MILPYDQAPASSRHFGTSICIKKTGGLSIVEAEGQLPAVPQRAILSWWWHLCGWFQWRLVQVGPFLGNLGTPKKGQLSLTPPEKTVEQLNICFWWGCSQFWLKGPGFIWPSASWWGFMWACCAPADHLTLPEVISTNTPPVCKMVASPAATCPVLPPKASQAAAFTVVVPTKDFSSLGLQLELTDTRAPMILRIEDGAIQEFNKIYKGSSIRPFDVLAALDGTQSWEAIQRQMTCELPDKMHLSLKRPRRVQVLLEKKRKNMGMTLAYTDKSVGISVQQIDPNGPMAKWNAQHDAKLEVLDRIIEFDGKAYCGTQLATLLEENQIWRLTVLKYSVDDPVLEGLSRRSFC